MPIYKMEGKKEGRQQYRVRINYTDKNGKSKQLDRVAYGLAEAKVLEMKLKQEYTKDAAPETRMTVRQLFDEYMAVKKHEVRETTYDKSKRTLESAVLPVLGSHRIDRLGPQVLQSWKNGIAERELSIRTKRNFYKEFHSLLNYAVKMEYLLKNPLNSIGTFTDVYFETPQDQLHYYTADQFKKFIAAAKNHTDSLTDWGYYVFFCIAFYTGMRKGEINALKWTDIAGDIIHVRRSVAQKLKGQDIVETPPKNRSSYRDLQMPLPLKKILEEHKARQQKDKRFTEGYRICGGPNCLRDSSIDNRNRLFAREAGLPHIRIHDFRHSHATLLCNEGINIQEIARRLGHSDIQMTWNTYSHLYPREEERAVQVLNEIM